MTTLSIEDYTIPAADLGPENPLPTFRSPQENGTMKFEDSVPESERQYMGWQNGFRVLPYRMQDQYTRDRRPRAFKAFVLENDQLRALFTPELNGRLASLVHKPSGRELLHRNPVFQPANVALRNAWISGGVEWNMGQPGHNYFTVSPVFAARLTDPDGSPVLRIYEWERAKCFPWQIDFHLPPDSPCLFAHVRLVNPHDREIPMYWWTNIAVEERADMRVLFPAENTLWWGSPRGLALRQLPIVENHDLTRSTEVPYAQEIFACIPEDRRPWVAHVDRVGFGLFQTSTARLRGRKLFCWGMNAGGRRWQEYLSAPGQAYIEIQAGLARTQLQCLAMPANVQWTWTEAFGALDTDGAAAHGACWDVAWRTVDASVQHALPPETLDARHAVFESSADRPSEELLHAGSGWGALERKRLTRSGEPDRIPSALAFAETDLGAAQQPWLTLLETGEFPTSDPLDDPGHSLVQDAWGQLLERAAQSPASDHWRTWYHLGVKRLEHHDTDGAREAWQKANVHTPSAWALRGLAVLEQREEHQQEANRLLAKAWALGPRILPLAIEYARALTAIGDEAGTAAFLESASDDVRNHERIRILAARQILKRGDYRALEGFFAGQFATNREGETTLTDLWFQMHELRIADEEGLPIDDALRQRVRRECPPPPHIDFRIAPDIR
ncbi:MAG TPA: DUF5107 domain-containing protein [Candidatus Hydrogenedentes bacterium]|nr:DUF5107 domain-containing protein [Candidatus Hydrogenedentota bacterium]HPG65195.1 DUF5107 domain-containing protein [Candidatus Hydrogenedentota bacterium]